jgi:hypothetical protein
MPYSKTGSQQPNTKAPSLSRTTTNPTAHDSEHGGRSKSPRASGDCKTARGSHKGMIVSGQYLYSPVTVLPRIINSQARTLSPSGRRSHFGSTRLASRLPPVHNEACISGYNAATRGHFAHRIFKGLDQVGMTQKLVRSEKR